MCTRTCTHVRALIIDRVIHMVWMIRCFFIDFRVNACEKRGSGEIFRNSSRGNYLRALGERAFEFSERKEFHIPRTQVCLK